MARRKAPPEPERREPAPLWVRQTRPGLTKFSGDLGEWRRARARWCRDNRCRRQGEPCTRMETLRCAESGRGVTGTVRVVSDGPA